MRARGSESQNSSDYGTTDPVQTLPLSVFETTFLRGETWGPLVAFNVTPDAGSGSSAELQSCGYKGASSLRGIPGVGAWHGGDADPVSTPGRPSAPCGQDGGAGDHLASTSLTASISPGAADASSAAWIGSKIKPSCL